MSDPNTECNKTTNNDSDSRAAAELCILKSRLKKLEKENTELRKEKSLYYCRKNEQDENIKKRLHMFEREYLIRSSCDNYLNSQDGNNKRNINTQLTSTNINSALNNNINSTSMNNNSTFINNNISDTLVNPEIDLKYALKSSINLKNLCSTEEIEKIKLFRNYFFDVFYSLDENEIINALNNINSNKTINISNNIKTYEDPFMEVFKIFCCKKLVFSAFFNRIYGMVYYLDDLIYITENVDVDWICEYSAYNCNKNIGINTNNGVNSNFNQADIDINRMSILHNNKMSYNNNLKSFIHKNGYLCIGFFIKLVNTRPRSVGDLLTQHAFDKILLMDTPIAKKFISSICDKGGLEYLNETNFHLIPENDLMRCFNNEYFN